MKILSVKQIDTVLLQQFDCGNIPLNVYISKFALKNDRSNIGRTFVMLDGETVVGYVTIVGAQVEHNDMPKEYKEKFPRYPVPAVRIARLAVDKKYQKQGYGKELLAFAFKHILIASINIGIKLIIVDAKEESMSFYEHFGFTLLQSEKNTYAMPIEQILKAAIDNKA